MPFSTQTRRQLDDELRAFIGLAFHLYTAAVLLDDPIGNAQSKPRAFSYGLGRKERIKDPGEILLGDAAAVVLDRNLNAFSIGCGPDPNLAVPVDRLSRILQ
jgi:hypothetical protein